MSKSKHSGTRLRAVLLHLRKQKISRKTFAAECGVGTVTINLWYDMDEFGNVVWQKLEPVLGKYNINPDYLRGTSERMIINEELAYDDQVFRKEVLKHLKDISDFLKKKV